METDLVSIPKQTDDMSGLSTLHVSYIIQNLIPLSVVDRQKLALFDKIFAEEQDDTSMSSDDVTLVAVGSSAEGLNMPNLTETTEQGLKPLELSDIDILLVMNQYKITFCQAEKPTIRFCDPRELFPWEVYAFAETNDIHPGYVRLNRSNTSIFSEYQDREMLLLNFRMRHMEKKEFVDVFMEVNGPALTIPVNASDRKISGRRLPLDKVLAMPCKEWPPTAYPCFKRFRDKGWLSEDLIQEIKDGGCHIVPVHHRAVDDKKSKFEWRISFATTERLIARTALTDVQKQAYVAIKALYHEKIKKLEILSSYHMKTTFLYTCERTYTSCWRENVFLCILFFLDLLKEFVVKRNIPNFFIPENNLVDYITEEQFILLEETLLEIRFNPLNPLLSFFDDKYFDELGVKLDHRSIFAQVISDMEVGLHHFCNEISFELFKSCSIEIMVKYIRCNNYKAAVETAQILHLFLRKYEKSNSEVESLAQIMLSTVKVMEDFQALNFCRYITERFDGDESFDCCQSHLTNLERKAHEKMGQTCSACII